MMTKTVTHVKSAIVRLLSGAAILYAVASFKFWRIMMIVPFSEIRHLIPAYTFNEYGQLTGNYVYADRIVCEMIDGRVKIWLDQESYDAKDPERLICDYAESDLRGL